MGSGTYSSCCCTGAGRWQIGRQWNLGEGQARSGRSGRAAGVFLGAYLCWFGTFRLNAYLFQIHGDPSLEHIVLPNRFFETRSTIHLAGWRYAGGYIGFEPRPGGMVRRRFLGAPEIDYHIFREDLEQHLLGLHFYEDEVEEALAAFARSYCRSFHLAMDESWKHRQELQAGDQKVTCGFADKSLEEYCKLLAKLQLTEDHPERVNWFFSEFIRSA